MEVAADKVIAAIVLANDISAIVVTVQDSGEGMSEQTRAQALAPFFTTRPTGTGLGLPIVGRIVEAHGGRVTIDGAPDEGTTVTVVLPEDEHQRLTSTWPRAGRSSLLP